MSTEEPLGKPATAVDRGDPARQAVLLDILSIVAQAEDPDALWPKAAERIKWILDFDRLDVVTIDPSRRAFDVRTVFEARPGVPLLSLPGLPLPTGLLGSVLIGPDRCRLLHPAADPIPPDRRVDEFLEGGALGSILLATLPAHGRTLGLLAFGCRAPHAYGVNDVDLAVLLTTHLGLVYERALHLRRMETAVRELDAFTYTVSHDLKAPLRSIHQFGDLLVEDYARALDDRGRDYLARIVSSARRMNNLIEHMLDYARLFKTEPAAAALDSEAVLREALGNLASDLEASNAEIRVEALPRVLGDPVLLEQVFTNLISNAVKFVRPGVRPRVRVYGEHRKGVGRVCVEDNGLGIPPEHREKLFRVFERLVPETAYPGTGIGLAIVKRVVERMNGTVWMEPREPEGSRFCVELPAAETESTGPAEPGGPPSGLGASPVTP